MPDHWDELASELEIKVPTHDETLSAGGYQSLQGETAPAKGAELPTTVGHNWDHWDELASELEIKVPTHDETLSAGGYQSLQGQKQPAKRGELPTVMGHNWDHWDELAPEREIKVPTHDETPSAGRYQSLQGEKTPARRGELPTVMGHNWDQWVNLCIELGVNPIPLNEHQQCNNVSERPATEDGQDRLSSRNPWGLSAAALRISEERAVYWEYRLFAQVLTDEIDSNRPLPLSLTSATRDSHSANGDNGLASARCPRL